MDFIIVMGQLPGRARARARAITIIMAMTVFALGLCPRSWDY